ncbi:Hypothetical protein PHPALM_19103 [Phytophthora palmivora]|uniref:Uncharacterized protein n=1 Tax=Phytophthora palmivora TaxID=4796 RepID=A0A2P4XI45_9STRA|nr:Hypothetical protein PHPALM_19103 [Phytophthora palmivora]
MSLLSQCLDSFTKLPEQQPRESVAALRLARLSPLVAIIKTKLGF